MAGLLGPAIQQDTGRGLLGSPNPFSPIASDFDRSTEILKALNSQFPGVQTLVDHSVNNVRLGKTVDRGNGKTSTISSMTVGFTDENGKNLRTFLVPTIFDGKALSGEDAAKRAEKAIRSGAIFPSVAGDNPRGLDELSRLISANLSNVNGMAKQ